MIGTHNSLTYLPVKHWWTKPFNFIAKCQNKDILQQLLSGVRIFDFRVRWSRKNPFKFVFAHGSMVYDLSSSEFWCILDMLNHATGPIYVRIMYESAFLDKYRDTTEQEANFCTLCIFIQNIYKNIIFFGGRRKYDWKLLYDFKTEEPEFRDAYSSVECKWLSWFPWLYAKYINKKINLNEYRNDNKSILMDFI